MDNYMIKRVREELEIGLHEVAFLLALPTSQKNFRRMQPKRAWLSKLIAKERDFVPANGLYDWGEYNEVLKKIVPLFQDLERTTKVDAIFDVTYRGFKKVIQENRYKWILLAAHHSRSKGKTEFLDGLVADQVLLEMLANHTGPKVVELCGIAMDREISEWREEGSYQMVGPIAYAFWDIPIFEGLQFLTTWLAFLKTYPKISLAYHAAVTHYTQGGLKS